MCELSSYVHMFSNSLPLYIFVLKFLMHMIPCCTSLQIVACFSFVKHLNLSIAHLHIQVVFIHHCVFAIHFFHIWYQTGTLDCQNKGTYLEDTCCSYSAYCDFYDSQCFLKKFICLVCLTFFSKLCIHAHVQFSEFETFACRQIQLMNPKFYNTSCSWTW